MGYPFGSGARVAASGLLRQEAVTNQPIHPRDPDSDFRLGRQEGLVAAVNRLRPALLVTASARAPGGGRDVLILPLVFFLR